MRKVNKCQIEVPASLWRDRALDQDMQRAH